MNNLFGKEGYEEVTKELKEELKKLQAQYNDPIEEKLKNNPEHTGRLNET